MVSKDVGSFHIGAIKDDAPSAPPYGGRKSHSLELKSDTENHIQNLARVFSSMSHAPSSNATMVNPFDEHKIPELDPFSPTFDAEQWVKSYFQIVRSDPERYPTRTAGVSYTDLSVFGFSSDTDYQKDVVNVLFHAVGILKGALRALPRIPILTDFDGLIKPGEMCVVLGRPGR
jgi:hypothetical protein